MPSCFNFDNKISCLMRRKIKYFQIEWCNTTENNAKLRLQINVIIMISF